MFCSDYPHSEGTATPLDDYRRMGCQEQEMPGLFHTNVDSLLNRDNAACERGGRMNGLTAG